MDWKKENISAAEFEKRQKEYISEAVAMMKKSGTSAVTAIKPDEPAAPVSGGGAGELVVPASGLEPEAGEEKPDAPIMTEEASDKLSEADGGTASPEDGGSGDEPDDKYGVYTADELLSGEYSGDGLKKAAEILEEMTRNTEIMKKLASGDDDGDPDTTDFPDFSGEACDDSAGGRFREGEETAVSPEETE